MAKQTIRREIPMKSKLKMSFTEFVAKNPMRLEVQAGFKAYLDGNLTNSEQDWKTLYEEYVTRQI